MIVKRIWKQRIGTIGYQHVVREGWYLFGFIPLYIRDLSVR